MSGCNWAKLLAKDRVKAIGIPWSKEEANAIYVLGIEPDMVRSGCLTLEDAKEEQDKLDELEKGGEEKPLKHMLKAELIAKATELGMVVSDEATKADLILVIESAK